MPRRAAANRREVQPDAVYNNRLVTQLINKVLLDGKKATAERIVYTAFEIVAEKSEGGDALATFKKAMDNVKPTLEVKPKLVGGATYQVPMEVNSVVPPLWVSAGSSTSPALARRRPWPSVSPTRSSTLPTAWALPSRSVRTSSRWPRPTARSLTIVGKLR